MNIFKKALQSLTFNKAISEAQWTGTQGLNQIGNISIEAASSSEKSLTPRQAYENSIPAYAAINIIAKSICKAKWRLFDRNQNEIIGGPLHDLLQSPMPRITLKRWVHNLICWYNISGEIALHINEGQFPTCLNILNPYRLYIQLPGIPKSVDDIVQWRYMHLNGRMDLIRADKLIYDRMFNPNDSVRGLSPLVTGTTEIGAAHQAARYRKQFFENSAIPSLVVSLPEGTPRGVREDFTRRFMSEFGTFNNQAHKVFVVSGGEAKVTPLESPFQNAPFLDLSRWGAMQVALIYGVPPAVMQFDATTKYDNANEQRLMFVEDTLVPQMELLQEVIQLQLIDPYFSFSPVVKDTGSRKNGKITKAMDERFEASRGDSNLILLIDQDTMPIMAQVKADQVAKAKEFREVLMLSPRETADYFKFDIPNRPERDEIYMLNNYVCVTNPEINKQLSPQLQGKDGKENTVAQDAKEDRKQDKAALKKSFDELLRKLRKLSLDSFDDNEVFQLSKADELDDGEQFRTPIRVIRHQIKAFLTHEDPKRALKDYFNHLKLEEVMNDD